jgi:hypothetical protein
MFGTGSMRERAAAAGMEGCGVTNRRSTLVVGPLASVRAEDEGRSANRASSSLELTFKKKNSGAQ